MTLKRKITFDLNKRGDKTDHLPIRMRITYAGDRFDAPMGYNIDLDKWDATTQRVRSGCSNKLKQTATEINLHLSERERGADRIFTRFELDGIIPKFEEVKAAYYAQYGSKQNEPTQKVEVTLLERFDEFIKEGGRAKDWSEATLKKFATVRKHLLGFMPEPRFDDLNENGVLDYISYLRDTKGMRNGTIDKYLGFMRWFLGWALAKGYHTNTAFQTFKPKLKRADIQPVFLTWEELMKVYYFELPHSKQYLERVRDVFCFCCFTSLRYSDVKNLKRSDIRADRLYVTTVKTADSLVIELNKYSRPILAKYADDLFKNNLALPVISNQKMNDYLKELGELCGINEPITQTHYIGNKRIDEVYPKYALFCSHLARRTFVSNALILGILPEVVMKWTGHNDYKAMKPYIAIADAAKQEAMAKFDEK